MSKEKINKMKESKGITLLALVVTIVILIILAVVAINFAFGENGLVSYADRAKAEAEMDSTKERLEIVLGSAYTEKKTSNKYESEEDFLNNYLEEYVYDREPDANIEIDGEYGDIISLNGYTFVLYRSVPQLGDYIGPAENLPPKIRSIKRVETSNPYSELSIEVTSARAEGGTYKYSIKKEGEEYSSSVEGGNTHTFTNLESQVKYWIKVELIMNEEVVDTKEEPMILGLLEEGNLNFGDITWSSGKASITVSTTTSIQIQYRIIPEEGEATGWTNISNNGTISNIANGATISARLWDGKNGSEEISRTIVDTTPPVITKFEATEVTFNSITVEVNAVDNESEIVSAETYKFYLNDETEVKGTSTDGTFTYEKLNGLTNYKLKVEVYDNAGNKEESTINVTTKERKIEEVLDITGNKKVYVEIPNPKDEKNPILCNVLYNDDTNGLQIISVNCVDTVTLGYGDSTVSGEDDFTKAMNSYNNAVETLNNKAEEYNYFGNEYVDARCVGSVPNNPSQDSAGYHTTQFSSSYSGQFKNTDTNYVTDYGQMGTLGIRNIGGFYWLESRLVDSGYVGSGFSVRLVNPNGVLLATTLCSVDSSGYTYAGSYSYGLRPVFTLKSGIKVTGGNGTSSYSPYTLGV